MNTKRLALFIVCFPISFLTFSQSLNKKEIWDLHTTISQFLMNKDKVNEIDTSRNSEFFYLIIDIDSCGKVGNTHLIYDEKNKHKTFHFLTQLTSEELNKIKFEKCRSKTIIVPIISIVKGKSCEYIERIKELYPIRRIDILTETGSLLIVDALRYTAPFSED